MKLVLGVALSLTTCLANAVSLYFHAHEDDIELFMARSAWSDVAAGGKVVIVNVTAGDAGRVAGPTPGSPVSTPFYVQREKGHEQAIQYWASLALTSTGGPSLLGPVTYTTTTIAGKSVTKGVINNGAANVVIYQLRLPDPGANPNGTPVSGDPSVPPSSNPALDIKALRYSVVASLTTVDGAATYTYSDLLNVIRGIISTEAHGDPVVFANIPDENYSLNPGDHTDHIETGLAVATAVQATGYGCVNLIRYQGYNVQNLAQNLSASETLQHAATFGALNAGLAETGAATTWNADHIAFLGRLYARTPMTWQNNCGF